MADSDEEGDLFSLDPGLSMERRSPQDSGTHNYSASEAVQTSFNLRVDSDYTAKQLLARLEEGKPRSVALHVRANTDGSTFDFEGMANFTDLGGVGATGLVLICDYGDLAGRHRVVADLRSGTYLLPAVTFAQVYALAWAQAGVLGFDFQVSAALSRDIPPNTKPFTYTGAGTLAAGGTVLVPVPYYAQWVDIWANGWAGGIGAANAPVLSAAEVGLYRDYTTGLFVPPWGPISLSGDSLDTDAFTLSNGGAASVRCFAQFYFEI